MGLKFQPKTEAEVNTRKLWPAGEYDFEIVKAEDAVSKAGNAMIKIVLKIFDRSGEYILLSDYLLSDEAMAFKLRHCCEAVGILGKYETGELEAGDFVTGAGQLKLKVRKSTDPNYPEDQNQIADYIKPDERTPKEKATSKKNHGIVDELNDSLPPDWA